MLFGQNDGDKSPIMYDWHTLLDFYYIKMLSINYSLYLSLSLSSSSSSSSSSGSLSKLSLI